MARYTKESLIYGEEPLNIYSEEVHQHFSDTCAIKSQQLVLQKFGIDISEEQLRNEAIQHGWYSPGHGTDMYDIGRLMELHGIPINQYEYCNVFNVINELWQGHQVIMGVDSGELWHPSLWEQFEDKVPLLGGADHALIISGVNLTNPNSPTVIVTDPGSGDLLKEYPLDQFVDAANDSHFYMVTTQNAVPHFFDSFPMGTSHLPKVGDMSYNFFVDHYAFEESLSHHSIFEEFHNNFWYSSEEFEDEYHKLSDFNDSSNSNDDDFFIEHEDDAFHNEESFDGDNIDEMSHEDEEYDE